LIRATGSRAVRIGTPSRPHSLNEDGEITLCHSGRWRSCTGRGRNSGTCTWKYLPLYVTGPPLQRRLMISTDSSIRSRPSSLRSPWPTNSYSLWIVPLPTPTSIRPFAQIVEQRQLNGEPHQMMER